MAGLGISNASREMALKPFPTIQRKAIRGAILNHVTAYKTTTSSIASSTTLTADSDFAIFLQANVPYRIMGNIVLDSMDAAGNVKMDFNGGTVTATKINGTAILYLANASTSATVITALSTLIDGGASTAKVLGTVDLLLSVPASGYLIPRFAQNTSSATATVIGINSYLYAFPLGQSGY